MLFWSCILISLLAIENLTKTLDDLSWNKSQTAKLLGISRPTLDQKIEKYGLIRPPKTKKKKKG